MNTSRKCEVCGSGGVIHKHHVLGRVGHFKNEPYNLIDLCFECHYEWHNKRSEYLENVVYRVMKKKHGDKFPMLVNGRKYYTKWLLKAMERVDENV